jgi:hypothetical protein
MAKDINAYDALYIPADTCFSCGRIIRTPKV